MYRYNFLFRKSIAFFIIIPIFLLINEIYPKILLFYILTYLFVIIPVYCYRARQSKCQYLLQHGKRTFMINIVVMA